MSDDLAKIKEQLYTHRHVGGGVVSFEEVTVRPRGVPVGVPKEETVKSPSDDLVDLMSEYMPHNTAVIVSAAIGEKFFIEPWEECLKSSKVARLERELAEVRDRLTKAHERMAAANVALLGE